MAAIGVLIVDDQPGYAELLASRLEDPDSESWRIRVATSGEEALKILEEDEGIEVLASDFLMPEGMDGAQLVNRALAFRPELYTIIFTGWSDRDYAVKSLHAGVDVFLDKTEELPSDLKESIRRGGQAMALSRIGRELLSENSEEKVFDAIFSNLGRLREFDGCCLAILGMPGDICRVAMAVDLKTGWGFREHESLQENSAYRYVVDEERVYLPPLFRPEDRSLVPFLDNSRSIVVVPVTLKHEGRGALGIEHREENHFGVEDLRLLNQVAHWISLAMQKLTHEDRVRQLEQEKAWHRRDLFGSEAETVGGDPGGSLVEKIFLRALVITEQESFGEECAAVLALEGYRCRCIAGSSRSLRRKIRAWLSSNEVDLVLTQQNMGAYQVLDLLEDVRTSAVGRPAVICLACNLVDRGRFYKENGAAFHVYKSGGEALEVAVAELLRELDVFRDRGKLTKSQMIEVISRYAGEVSFHDLAMEIFRDLGYLGVDPYHGPNEKGKDIVCWEVNRLGEKEYLGIQIKLGDIDGSEGKNGITNIFRQVYEAFTSSAFLDGAECELDKFVLMVSGVIKPAAKEKLKEFISYHHLHRKLAFFDKARIADMVLSYCPDVTRKLTSGKWRKYD